MKIAILGPPGSGKGTQIELIEKDFNVNVVAIGKILRNISKKKTKLGKAIDRIIDRGNLIPSRLADKLILKKLKHKNIIFDGYPRNLTEARFLESKIRLDKVILLKANRKTIINRLKNRKTCLCGMTYNLLTKKPKKDLTCDRCNKKLVPRDDDNPKAIKKRIEVYEKKTLPVIRHYKRKNILIEINSNKSIKQVYKILKKHLRNV